MRKWNKWIIFLFCSLSIFYISCDEEELDLDEVPPEGYGEETASAPPPPPAPVASAPAASAPAPAPAAPAPAAAPAAPSRPPTPPDPQSPAAKAITINEGVTETLNPIVTVNIQGDDNRGIVAYAFGSSISTPTARTLRSTSRAGGDTSSMGPWIPISPKTSLNTNVSYTLPKQPYGRHTHTVHLYLKDAANNVSPPVTSKVTFNKIDTAPPISPSVIINEDADTTISVSVTLTITAEDDGKIAAYFAAETSIIIPLPDDTGWLPVSPNELIINPTVPFTLTGGNAEGTFAKTVYVWFKDIAGNVSEVVSDDIDLFIDDIALPTNPGLAFVDNITKTNTTSVNVELSATDNKGITAYFLSESQSPPSPTDEAWVSVTSMTNFSKTVSYTLAGTSGPGVFDRTVYVWYKDNAGLVSTSASKPIELTIADVGAPNGNITLNNNNSFTTNTTIPATINAVDNVGVTGYYLSESGVDPLPNAIGWVNVPSTNVLSKNDLTFTLAGGPPKTYNLTVYVWYRDAAGNLSTRQSKPITLTIADVTPPSGTIKINYGATLTNSAFVFVNLNYADDIGVSKYYISESNVTPTPNQLGWFNIPVTLYDQKQDWTLQGGTPGTHVRTLYAWTMDPAGNISSREEDSINLIIYDVTKPTGTVSINNGDTTANSLPVTLNLSASDDVGVTEYFVSESPTSPATNNPNWKALTPSTSISKSVSFTFNQYLESGTQKVYVWYRDDGGNIALPTSDEITIPLPKAKNISFEDNDGNVGQIGGDILVEKADSETGVGSYVLYWGSSEITKLDNTPLATFTVGQDLKHSIAMNTLFHFNATHFLVYVKDKNDVETSKGIAIPIGDNISFTKYSVGAHYERNFRGIAYNGSKYMAVLDWSETVTSTDLQTWAYSNKHNWQKISSILYANNLFVLVGGGKNNGYVNSFDDNMNFLKTSITGSNWYTYSDNVNSKSAYLADGIGVQWPKRYLKNVIYANGLYIATGDDSVIATTIGAGVWTMKNISIGQDLNNGKPSYDIAYGDGKYVRSASGVTETSSDLTTWENQKSVTAGNLIFGKGLFVGLGSEAKSLVTSPDGINWTTHLNKLPTNNIKFHYNHGLFMGTDDQSNIFITSLDGINWTSQIIPTGENLNSAIYVITSVAGYSIVAVGEKGTIFKSNSLSVIHSKLAFESNKPTGSVAINNGDASAFSLTVNLDLSASDDVKVIDYLASESSTIPSPSDSNWKALTPGTSISESVSFTFNGFNESGTQKVYVWYRDFWGNLSDPLSDEISIPIPKAKSLTFTDIRGTPNELEGDFIIEKSDAESDMSAYVLYWGSSASTKRNTWSIATIPVGQELKYSLPYSVYPGSTHFLVYMKDKNDVEMSQPLAIPIEDRISFSKITAAGFYYSEDFNGIAYGSDKYVALVRTDKTATSTDLINWTDGYTFPKGLKGIVYAKSTFVVIGGGMDSAFSSDPDARLNYLSISSDGTTWTDKSDSVKSISVYQATDYYLSRPMRFLRTLSYSGGIFIASGDDFVLATSSYGSTWTIKTITPGPYSDEPTPSYEIAYGIYQYVRHNAGTLETSTNGTTWENAQSISAYGLVFGNGKFVGMGPGSNDVVTSPYGNTWTVHSGKLPVSRYQVKLTYSNGFFIGTGNNILITSKDGINWVKQTIPPSLQLKAATFANGSIVAIGHYGAIIKSTPLY